MAIEFQCANCRKLLRVGDSAAGKKARCPDCGTIQVVPAAMPQADSNAETPRGPSPSSLPPPSRASAPSSSPADVAASPFLVTPTRAAANPFADSPFRESGASVRASNPYLAAQTAMSPAGTEVHDRPSIERRVATPAIALLVLQLLNAVLCLPVLALTVFSFARNPNDPEELGNIAVQAILLAMSGISIYGAYQMRRLRKYGFSLAASILTIFTCSPCCLVSLGIGIWSLVVLLDSNVKRFFT